MKTNPLTPQIVDKVKGEVEYKRDWINQHNIADEIVCDDKTKEIIAAIYYYPPTEYKSEQRRIWNAIAQKTLIAELEELESEQL